MFEMFNKKEKSVQDDGVSQPEIDRQKAEDQDALDDVKHEEEQKRADEHHDDMNRLFPPENRQAEVSNEELERAGHN